MLTGLFLVFQASECKQNQLFESQHLPRPAEPQPAFTVRQQDANHQQRTVRPAALHQDSVRTHIRRTHVQVLKLRIVHFRLILSNESRKGTCFLKHDTWDNFVGTLYNSYLFLFPWQTQTLPLLSPLSFTPLSHLAQNPFMCDCHLKWLADYLFDNPIETSGARCSHPRRLANKRLSQVKGKKFRCTGKTWECSHVVM